MLESREAKKLMMDQVGTQSAQVFWAGALPTDSLPALGFSHYLAVNSRILVFHHFTILVFSRFIAVNLVAKQFVQRHSGLHSIV